MFDVFIIKKTTNVVTEETSADKKGEEDKFSLGLPRHHLFFFLSIYLVLAAGQFVW